MGDGPAQRILVVDDEESIVDAVATSLRYEGFDVARASTGRAALAAAQEHPPDLIVLDVTKPFSLAEVVARTRAILRRTQGEVESDGRLRFADLEMDDDTHEVWRSGTPLRLTATEFSLLRFFLLNPRRVLSKSQILDHVWHYDFGGDASVVETYVSYLRKKLDKLGPPLIQTIRLVGYSLREPGS
jgi:two-component system OmpR family response regulator